MDESPDQIRTRADFVAYVYRLARDFEEHGGEWENPTLDRYLLAVGDWVASMDGYFHNTHRPQPPEPDWKLFATILTAATVYE